MLKVTHVKVVGEVTKPNGEMVRGEVELPLRDFVRMLAIGTETVAVQRGGKTWREERPAIVVRRGGR